MKQLKKEANGIRPAKPSSRAGSHNFASLFPLQESEKGKTIAVIYGQNILDLLENLGRPGLLRKTLLASLVWKINPLFASGYFLTWKVKTVSAEAIRNISIAKGRLMFLTRSLKILKERVIKSKYIIFQLAVSKRGTRGSGYGLLPTPKVQNANDPGMHGQGGMDLQTYAKMLPTPTSQDSKHGAKGKSQAGRNSLPGIMQETKNTGSLNPDWVEWLQGYPIGWTDIGTKNPKVSHKQQQE